MKPATFFTLSLLIIILKSSFSQDFKQHIIYLTNDKLIGREAGTESELNAASYIDSSLGNKCVKQYFPYLKDTAINVVYNHLNNEDSIIMIVAHYDHLGTNSIKSKEVLKKGIHPGADDNASGVALSIELANYLIQNKKQRYNYIFLFTSGHEMGLFGAEYFANSSYINYSRIKYLVNFDMVGRMNNENNQLRLSSNNLSAIKNINNKLNSKINFVYDDSLIEQTDAKFFVDKVKTCITITTGIHSDYHKLSDTEEKINYAGMKLIFEYLVKILEIK